VLFSEICWLDELAESCAADNRWTFFYVAAPLNIVGGTGAPVNPVAIK
jgi:kynurenine formamidase